MSVNPVAMTPELYHYAVNMSLRENDFLRQLREETATLPGGRMMAAPEQSQFISLIIQLMQAKNILEIGTFTGYSTLAMAQALPQNGKIITCDIDPRAPAIGRKYWEAANVLDKIDLVIAPGLSLLNNLLDQGLQNTFDLAFIDADKKNNSEYYDACLQLLRPNGLMLIDNIFWHGTVLDKNTKDATTQAIQKFNQQLNDDERILLSIIPLGDGFAVVLKK